MRSEEDQDRPAERRVHVDRPTHSLVVDGLPIALDSRSFHLIEPLADRFGERVSKDELLAIGWPGQLVGENSLAKAISRLRRLLEGSGLEIAASYGIGYVLRDTGTRPAAIAGSRDEESPSAPRRNMGARWLGAGLLLAAALLGVLLFLRPAGPDADPAVAIRDTPPITHDSPRATATILWVDDHPANNVREVALFKRRNVAVHLARSTEDALKLLAMNDYRLVISDLGRGDDRLAGLGLARAMAAAGERVPLIIYTIRAKDAAGQATQRRLVAEAGATDLAVTPEEVRAKALALLARPAPTTR